MNRATLFCVYRCGLERLCACRTWPCTKAGGTNVPSRRKYARRKNGFTAASATDTVRGGRRGWTATVAGLT